MIKAAVLGSPISHSLSPLLHSTAYQELGVAGSYQAIEVKAGGLLDFISTLDMSWTGFSLTMPLKEEVIIQASTVDALAKRINSANTLFRGDNGWQASTTDVLGFENALHMHEVDTYNHVVILGAGATARAAAAACDSRARRITVLSRSQSRLPDMSKAIVKAELDFRDWNDSSILSQADLVISTTPEGVTDSFPLPLKTTKPFFEALYHPWPTQASREWAARGGLVIDGLDLLIHQAMAQVKIFTGLEFDSRAMYARLRATGVLALK